MKASCLIFIFFLSFFEAAAQCSMCKAVAETSGEGEGLNSGILYLMVVPYLLFFAIGFFIFRQRRKKALRTE